LTAGKIVYIFCHRRAKYEKEDGFSGGMFMKLFFFSIFISLFISSFCFAKEEIVFQETYDNGIHVTITFYGRMTAKVANQFIDSKKTTYDIFWDDVYADESTEVAKIIYEDFDPVPNSLYLYEIFEAGELRWHFIYYISSTKYNSVSLYGHLGG
jgi:hypothetical protein